MKFELKDDIQIINMEEVLETLKELNFKKGIGVDLFDGQLL